MSPEKKESSWGADRRKSDHDKNPSGLPKGQLRWMGFGFELAGVVGLFCYGGYRLDERWQTGPWLMIAGAAVAFAGMVYWLIKETRPWQK